VSVGEPVICYVTDESLCDHPAVLAGLFDLAPFCTPGFLD